MSIPAAVPSPFADRNMEDEALSASQTPSRSSGVRPSVCHTPSSRFYAFSLVSSQLDSLLTDVMPRSLHHNRLALAADAMTAVAPHHARLPVSHRYPSRPPAYLPCRPAPRTRELCPRCVQLSRALVHALHGPYSCVLALPRVVLNPLSPLLFHE